MKKEWGYYWKSKTFRNYLVSFVGIFLLLLGIVGIWIVGKLNRNMRAEEERLIRSKLYTVVQDMEKQSELMHEVATEIASFPKYQFKNLKKSKYQEIDMLESLKQYDNVCQICDFLFIRYKESEMLFMSAGNSKSLEVYLEKNFAEELHPEILDHMLISCQGEGKRIEVVSAGTNVLFLYSLEQYSVQSGQHAVLVFHVSQDTLKERIETIVGRMDGSIHMHYKDQHLIGQNCDGQIEKNWDESYIKQTSLEGNYTVWYDKEEMSSSIWDNVFSVKELAFILCGLFGFLLLGILIAWWNFKPVRRIAEKLGVEIGGDNSADWTSIERLIESLLKGSERDGELLKTQYQILREQTIQLILSGKYSDRAKEYMTILNIRMDADVYGVIRCVLKNEFRQEELGKTLYREVKELASEGISLYPCWDNQGDFYVLAAAEERYQLEDISELLRALFEAKEIQVKISIQGAYKSLEDIGRSQGKQEYIHKCENLSGKQNHTALQVVKYIEENCTNYELSLDFIAQEFEITPSYLCRLIKMETGRSYKEYLTELRMECAKRMLKNSSVSVVDCCQKTGYSNVSHFIKVFQKYTGVTPAKYRDELERERL